MPRRIALALSLAFTVVVSVAVAGIGARSGLFGSTQHPQPANAAVVTAPAPPQASAAAAPRAPQAPDPVVVTQYVYVDDTPVAVTVAPQQAQGVSSPAEPPGAASATARATTTAAAAPTTPAATATQPPLPSATPPAAATVTPAPAQQQPTPTALPYELEFQGTVSAINGSQVTFSYGSGKTVVVTVNNSGNLSVGERAEVHAKLTSSGYVATEINTGD
jgi:hypothetical protein